MQFLYRFNYECLLNSSSGDMENNQIKTNEDESTTCHHLPTSLLKRSYHF